MEGRLHIRLRTAVPLALALALAIAPVPAVADAPSGAAVDRATIISSFAPTFEDRTVVGGTQEVTIVAPPSGSADVIVPLGPTPCACAITSVVASTGSVTTIGPEPAWTVGDLDADATATLVVVWAPAG